MKRTCSSIEEVADVINHNTEVFARSIKQINKKLGRLERKRSSCVWFGIIFGTIVELCFMEQSRRITALDGKLRELNTEIEGLREKEGD